MPDPEPVDLSFVGTDVWGGSVLMWATPFTDVKNLVDQALAKLKPGQCIRRLIIAGHGAEKTDGFFVFDPDLSGAQLIDGGSKREPISSSVVKELQRLKARFCKDGIIEFRVCRMGSGTSGEKAMTAVADVMGVPVTAPMGEIKGIAAVGGIATDWRVAYPTSWGVPSGTSFWRGVPTQPPVGAPGPADVAPATSQVVPLRSVTTPPAATVLPPIGKVSMVDRVARRRRRRRFGAGAAVAGGGLALFGVWLLNTTTPGPGVGLASPSVPPTQPPVTATTTPPPTASPTATPSPTAAPTATPTASTTPQPTPSLLIGLLDGTYFGSGMFTSFDGQDSFPTNWRVTKVGDTIEIAQLLSPGGPDYQVLQGIVDPGGLAVAVSDDPGYCELFLIGIEHAQLPALEVAPVIAYGPSSMTCPDPAEVAPWYLTLDGRPEVVEPALRDRYNWGSNVVIGSVAIDGWTEDQRR